jgi:hypothetical protein
VNIAMSRRSLTWVPLSAVQNRIRNGLLARQSDGAASTQDMPADIDMQRRITRGWPTPVDGAMILTGFQPPDLLPGT